MFIAEFHQATQLPNLQSFSGHIEFIVHYGEMGRPKEPDRVRMHLKVRHATRKAIVDGVNVSDKNRNTMGKVLDETFKKKRHAD